MNLFAYGRNSPLRFSDPTGTSCDPTMQSCIDPTEPTAREEALQKSLPESERNLPPPGAPSIGAGLSLAGNLLRSAQVEGVLIGTSRSQMRSAAQALIASDPNNPFQFLLGENGKFKPTRGLSHAELADAPDLVQMGHIGSNKLGGPERLMLQDAWENQFQNLTVEHPRIGGAAVAEQPAVDIGGIAISRRTAQTMEMAWEYSGGQTGLPPGTTARAPVIPEFGSMSSGTRWLAGGAGTLNAVGGVFMLASIDTKRDPGIVTVGKVASGGASVIGGGMQIGGAAFGAAGVAEVGAAASGVGLIIAAPIMIYEMRPRGMVAIDPVLMERNMQRQRNGENVNSFCAQCHGVGGALDPNNDWNAGGARRAAFVNRLQWKNLGD